MSLTDKKPKRAPASLYSKILSIQSEAEASEKDITITMGGRTFKATTIEAVLDVYLPICKKYKVGIIPIRVEPVIIPNSNPQNFMALYHYSLVDTENADSHEFSVLSTGVDGGDKAAGKAATYALKYAYLQLFSGRRGDDPDFNGDARHAKKDEQKPKTKEQPKEQAKAQAPSGVNPDRKIENAKPDGSNPLQVAADTIKAKFDIKEIAKTQVIPGWKSVFKPFVDGVAQAIDDATIKSQVNEFGLYWWVCCATTGEKSLKDAAGIYERNKKHLTKAQCKFVEEILSRRQSAMNERQPGEDG